MEEANGAGAADAAAAPQDKASVPARSGHRTRPQPPADSGEDAPPAGMVLVELSGHIDIAGEPRLPNDTVWVTPDEAASLRRSGYTKRADDPTAAG